MLHYGFTRLLCRRVHEWAPRRFVLAVLLFAFLATPQHAPAQQPPELQAKKLQTGVFANVWSEETTTGLCVAPPLRLEERTDEVPASLLTRFGYMYMLSGGPARQHRLDIVIHHPPMENPTTGEKLTTQVLEVEACPGTPAFAGWSFTAGWELVSGEWTVELRQGGRKLLEHGFRVTVVEEFPQMQLEYSLLPEDRESFEALFLSRPEIASYLENIGLGESRSFGIFPGAEAAQERAAQCRAQGQTSAVVQIEGMSVGGYLAECVDFARMRGPDRAEDASGHGEDQSSGASGQGEPAADAGGEPAVDDSVGATLSPIAGNATSDMEKTPAATGVAEEPTPPAGGYAMLFDMSESAQAANLRAGELEKALGIPPQVRRLPGNEQQWLYGVFGPPQRLDNARRSVALLDRPEEQPFVVMLGPLQALARGEGRVPGTGAGAATYDPSLSAMSREVEAQALEALREAEQELAATPWSGKIDSMPEDDFGPENEEVHDPRSWNIGGQSRRGVQDSPPVSIPDETGVDVLVARTDRRNTARRIAEELHAEGVEAKVRRLGPKDYEVRVENLRDPRAARQVAQRISARTGRNATVVLEARAGVEGDPETAGSPDAATYAVQVMSTRVRGEAERSMKTLRDKGYDPRSVEVPGTLGAWFSIRIGAYGSLEEAQEATRKFSEEEGIAAIVVEGETE
ncbi:MAG: DUF3859 domain-containing protein [Oceanidesulfovibrio sp.]